MEISGLASLRSVWRSPHGKFSGWSNDTVTKALLVWFPVIVGVQATTSSPRNW
jgi:hypothetical protein